MSLFNSDVNQQEEGFQSPLPPSASSLRNPPPVTNGEWEGEGGLWVLARKFHILTFPVQTPRFMLPCILQKALLLFSRQVASNCLQSHGPQYARPPCPSPCPRICQVVLWIGNAIQLSHPLLPSSPFAFNRSQHEGLFQWVCSSHQVAKVLELQLQHQSFQWIFKVDFFL